MTPEEQFRYINNTLQHSAEMQARLDERQALHEQNLSRIEFQTEKNAASIRDLDEVSRRVVDALLTVVDELSSVSSKLSSATEKLSSVTDELSSVSNKQDGIAARQDTIDDTLKRLAESQVVNEALFKALLQAQQETEQKLQRWIDRQSN